MLQQRLPLDDEPALRQALFVETTAHVDLAIGSPEVREELERILDANEAWSSAYVRMEFRRTAVHALAVARGLAAAAPDDRELFPWMLRAIDRGQSGYGRLLTTRQRDRSRAAVYMVMERLGGTPAARAVVVTLLDNRIRLVEGLAWAGIRRYVDETDCDLVRPERPQGRRWPLTCNAREAQCRQSLFLDQRRSRLADVLSECETDPDFDDAKMVDVLRAVLAAAPIRATGQGRCWPLGDLILALEALQAGRLLSSNSRHFEPICRALGITLVTYSPFPGSPT